MLSVYLNKLPPQVRNDCVELFNRTPKHSWEWTEEHVIAHAREYLALGAPLITSAALAIAKFYGMREPYYAFTELYKTMFRNSGLTTIQQMDAINEWPAHKVLQMLDQQKRAA